MEKKFSGALKKRMARPKPPYIKWSELSFLSFPNWVTISPKHVRPPAFPIPFAAWAADQQRFEREQQEKLDLLAKHYGIPNTADRNARLVLKMAEQFVPGFRFMNKRGAPKKWPDNVRGALVVVIDALKQPGVKGKGPTYVAKHLSQYEPWCRMVKGLNDPAGALLNVYKTTRRNEGELVHRVQKMKESCAKAKAGAASFDQLVTGWIAEAISAE